MTSIDPCLNHANPNGKLHRESSVSHGTQIGIESQGSMYIFSGVPRILTKLLSAQALSLLSRLRQSMSASGNLEQRLGGSWTWVENGRDVGYIWLHLVMLKMMSH